VRLTVYTDYALRLLIYLAVSGEGLATIEEIAESYGVSKNHLMKVAHQLGVGGYIKTMRGRHGGLRLAKPPKEIGLGDVVRYTEAALSAAIRLEPLEDDCEVQPDCVIHEALGNARRAFIAVLDEYTLDDLVRPRSALRTVLSISPGAETGS